MDEGLNAEDSSTSAIDGETVWKCDLCKEATFDTCDEAVAHEQVCTTGGSKTNNDEKLNTEWRQQLSLQERENNHESLVQERSNKHAEEGQRLSSQQERKDKDIALEYGEISVLQEKSTAEGEQSLICDFEDCGEKKRQRTEDKRDGASNTTPKSSRQYESTNDEVDDEASTVSIWECDICRKAAFENYDDAVAHEKKCTGGKAGGSVRC